MHTPTISIIIPVYNHQEALSQALASIVAQTYRPLEIIIVDDGSNSPVQLPVEVQKEQSDIFSVKLIKQANKGAPAARNNGFEHSSGSLVIFWDADVIAKPDMLESMVEALQVHPEADFVYSNFYFGHKKMRAQTFSFQALKQRNYIHSTSLIRQQAVVSWDERLKRFQDWDYWLRLGKKMHEGTWIDAYLFRVIPRKLGMSQWLPSFAYKSPWKYLPWWSRAVKKYEQAKKIIEQKHHLMEK